MPVAVPNNESVGEKIFYGIFGAIILGFFGLIIYADQLPNLKRSWEKQGDEAFAQGNYFEAAKFYTRIPDIEKDETFRLREGITADSLKVRGFRLIGQNDLEGAIARFDRSVNLRPGDHVTWGMRGYALQRDNDLEDALFSYEKALEIKPDYLPALTHKAEVLREQERYDEAVPVYWDCIGLDKTKGHIWSGKADCHFETGDFGLAADSYQKAIERSPEIKRNWLRRGESLYEIGKFRESIKLFDYVAKSGTSSQRKKSRFKRTKAYFKLGEKWNGIRAYMFNTTSEEI